MNDGHAGTPRHNAEQQRTLAEHVGKEASISHSLLNVDRGLILDITINPQHFIVIRFAWMVRWDGKGWMEIDTYEYVLHRSTLPHPGDDGRIIVSNGEHAFKIFPHGVAIDRSAIKPRA